jgi:hypothetical protein
MESGNRKVNQIVALTVAIIALAIALYSTLRCSSPVESEKYEWQCGDTVLRFSVYGSPEYRAAFLAEMEAKCDSLKMIGELNVE